MATDDSREAVLRLFEEVFVSLLALAEHHKITIKQMADLLPVAQVNAMRRQGKTQQQIMAASDYALKTIRRFLAADLTAENSRIERFIGDWTRDPDFPSTLPLNGHDFPAFADVVQRYGGEFRPGALQEILVEQGQVVIKGNTITLKSMTFVPITTASKLSSAQMAAKALLTTLNHNTLNSPEPYFERRVWSHSVPPEKQPTARAEMKAYAQECYDEFVKILARHEEPLEDTTRHQNVGFGLYWFQDKG